MNCNEQNQIYKIRAKLTTFYFQPSARDFALVFNNWIGIILWFISLWLPMVLLSLDQSLANLIYIYDSLLDIYQSSFIILHYTFYILHSTFFNNWNNFWNHAKVTKLSKQVMKNQHAWAELWHDHWRLVLDLPNIMNKCGGFILRNKGP